MVPRASIRDRHNICRDLFTGCDPYICSNYLPRKQSSDETGSGKINFTYLNPLRLHLLENYFRLAEILTTVSRVGRSEPLLSVNSAADISEQSDEWFNGQGCYLISSSYLTASLFYQMRKVRDDLPFLRLGANDDTKLMTLMIKVSLGFLRNLGIFYLTQPSIGNDMYLPNEGRLITYREFCQTLKSPKRRIWFDRLLRYYLETGRGENLDRVHSALSAMRELLMLLDQAVAGGNSLKERFESEGIKSL